VAAGCQTAVCCATRRPPMQLALPRPALHINGGGVATRADAERESLAAIAFALEGDPRDYDREADTITLDVSVAPAA
jgi:hypothetical protein